MDIQRLGRCAVALAALLALAGCSALPGATLLPDGLGYLRSGSRLLVVHPHQDGGADALITGRLGVNTHGCVTVGRSVIVTDAGSRFVGTDRLSLSGQTFTFGQQVQGGGGTNGSTSTDLDASLRTLCGVGIAGTVYFDPLLPSAR